MFSFILKDLRILIRDRTELLILLLMPFILIGILGFALRGIFDGDTASLEMDVAVVQIDEEEAGIEMFLDELEQRGVPQEQLLDLESAARETMNPSEILRTMLEEELADMITVVHTDAETAETYLLNEEVAAVLTIPEEFTFNTLLKMMLDEGEGGSFEVTVNEYGAIHARIFNDIMHQFTRQMNVETAIARVSEGQTAPVAEAEAGDIGGVESVMAAEPVNAMQYYALGMAVMFVLYVSSTLSSKAFVEKKQHVFDRILLAGTDPMTYLSGKFISASVAAFIQLAVLFLTSSLLFQTFSFTSTGFWAGMAGISAVLSLCVGGFAALLTAIAVRFNQDAVSNIFAGGIVSVFAFLGGSYFPTGNMPELFTTVGSWTPNGAGLTAYLQWIQGYGMETVTGSLLRIVLMTVILVIASVLIFPKRRSEGI
ncbi:ABC transporter permease [Bacillus sp. H-16]|uniref:ABC transporter permease n=1 Tax=Alteribacter salitolerans TaxID=2912333 RepID=UPI001965DB12|nr:ABC transporter permease [Alteribacter salitolerans]MBM7095089.1 ABC transporter permease [Alteribacter salitolerans]